MYKPKQFKRTSIEKNTAVEGETIEQKLQRIVNNKEPITDGAPMIYTERKDGVLAGYNIKTDRFDVALEGTDIIAKSIAAKRENKAKMDVVKDDKNDGGAEPTQDTK